MFYSSLFFGGKESLTFVSVGSTDKAFWVSDVKEEGSKSSKFSNCGCNADEFV